jgi:hypothetical protein
MVTLTLPRPLWLILGVVACAGGDPPEESVRDPGLVVAHRLNRAEYDNTVRDLFATTQRPSARFPADDFTLGFSNISNILSISSTHIELYDLAADDLLAEIASDRIAPVSTLRLEAETAAGVGTPFGAVRNLWVDGDVLLEAAIPSDGTWEVTLVGTATPVPVAVAVAVDGAAIGEVDVSSGALPALSVALDAGPHTVAVSLVSPGDPESGDAPVVQLDAVQVAGPIGQPLAPGPGRALIFTCDPATIGEAPCAEQIVRGFGTRAWRRPMTSDELDRVMALYAADRAAGGDWEEAVLVALKGILLAPAFVYRLELDPDPASTEPRLLDGYELASRLSYFLWASMPDAVLFDLAATGQLQRPDVIRAQVARMLRDPKAGALVDTLGDEWFYLEQVDAVSPNADVFPSFDEGLRASMREEGKLFTAGILLQDRSMLALVNGTDTWIDARLAAHYGLEVPDGPGFFPVSTPDRPGIMSRASWLTSLSYATRTSPVRRGKWVLENLMCEPTAPPPAGIPALPGDTNTDLTQSVRDQLEEHRANPACASCHAPMDGIGFGLEGFDGIGQERTADADGNPIDATGNLISGALFEGPAELGAALAADPKTSRCMVQKVFLFSLGRTLRPEDLVFLDAIHTEFAASDYRFSALASAIATSAPFRYRTPAEAAP